MGWDGMGWVGMFFNDLASLVAQKITFPLLPLNIS